MGSSSDDIKPSLTGPPAILNSIDLDVRSPSATHIFLTSILTSPESPVLNHVVPVSTTSKSIVVLLGNSAIQLHSTPDNKAIGYARGLGAGVKISLVVKDIETVKNALELNGLKFKDDVHGEDGLKWVEFSDPDGYPWAVTGLPKSCACHGDGEAGEVGPCET